MSADIDEIDDEEVEGSYESEGKEVKVVSSGKKWPNWHEKIYM